MENIKFVAKADFNAWKDAIKVACEIEKWIFCEEDYSSWNEGFGSDNFSFLVATEIETNKIIGHAAYAFYPSINGSETIATSGAFFVLPKFRGSGLGLEITHRMLNDPKGVGYNKAVIGVGNMTKKYAMFGLDKYPQWQYEDMEAKIEDIDPKRLESSNFVKTLPLKYVNFDAFISYDSRITGGIRRDGFIKKFLESKNAFSKVAINLKGEIVGFGNIRIGYSNQLAIGPLYADSGLIAETLLKEILESIENLHIYSSIFYYPSSSAVEAKAIFYKLAYNKVTKNENMFVQFTDRVPKVNAQKVYSMTEYGLSFC